MTTLDSDIHDFDDDTEKLVLPRRRRLQPISAVLALAIVGAGTFIAGVEVQKHWGASSPSNAGGGNTTALASRFANRAGGTQPQAQGGNFGGATIGTVSVIKGSTLYVTDTSGNTVKVTTSPGTTVSKTATSSVKTVKPGDTVVVRGTTAKNGNVSAEAITIGGLGGFGGGGLGGGAAGFGGGNGGAAGFGR